MWNADSQPAKRTVVGGAAVVAAMVGLATPARADCVRDDSVVTCATPSPNGYDETVTSGRTDRTVNVSADVADGIDITLSAGGDIAIDQTAGTITNNYGDAVYLKTTDGKITGTVGSMSTKDNGLELVASEIDVTVAGSVSGTGRYSSGVVLYEVGSVKLTNSGGADHAITGNTAGVNVWRADSLTLVNENGSSIVGTARDGTGVFAYSVSGDVWVSNDASSITGPTALGAWDIGGDVTVLNGSGTMTGSGYGVDIWSVAGNAKVINGSGVLAGGTYSGVSLVEVAGDVELRNGAGGQITSTSDYGVLAYLVEGDTLIENRGGLISSGSSAGIYADGARVSIVNGSGLDADEFEQTGFITGGIVIDSGAYSEEAGTGGATLTNEAGGVIISQPLPVLDGEITRDQIAAASGEVVVQASGGRIVLANDGILIGRVSLTGADDTFENSRVWMVTGINDFGAGADVLTSTGTIYAAAIADTAETTRFDGLESFANHGIFSLADGGAGDIASFSGDISFEKGATYIIDVDLAGQADLISVAGTATIDSGAGIRMRGVDGIAFGTDYHVLTAADGVDGNFGSVAGEVPVSAFVGLTSTNTGNDIFVRFDQARAFTAAAATRNQLATAAALDTLPTKGPTSGLREALLFLQTDAQARGAFDRLSGEVHASAQSLFVEQSGLVRNAMTDRLRAAQGAVGASSAPVLSYGPAAGAGMSDAGRAIEQGMAYKAAPASAPGPALWATGFGSWSEFDGTGNAASLSGSTGGFLIGTDTALAAGWRLGLAGGYSATSFDVDGRASSGDSDNWHLGVYGGNQWGALALRAGLAYTWQDVSTSRSVAFAGYADSLKADYNAGLFQAFGELGYRWDTALAAFEPFANLAYVSLDTDGFGERGGAAALAGTGSGMDTSFTTLGVRLEKDIALGRLSTTLRGTAGWRHAFGDITPVATQAFLGAASFDTAGIAIAEDAAVVEAGLDVLVGATATLGVAYTGQFGDGVTQNGFNATMKIDF
ncbi:autotransporter domain-containing protein [Ancylobacter dichloromethanicus]|uniref:Serine protease n=1 Tax=Ancylobacter dichloromethanicus TaxID=518825 RepID=A0A9W6JAN6_9HYPH|nr:autotransporter domain-containing protein [Ancylobacter dichloromethanicus]MBS7556656.1 autotransporter domain-containing protein [Ancylobacter dichloromethanicus]GLK73507.1 serine protease [Ancylobacter dichloromethanicus]